MESSKTDFEKDPKSEKLCQILKVNAFCRGIKPVNKEQEYKHRLAKAHEILEDLTEDSGSTNSQDIREYIEQSYKYDDESDFSNSQEYYHSK